MAWYSYYFNTQKLNDIGISEDIFNQNMGIIDSIFNQEWLEEKERKFNRHPFSWRSMEPLLNNHPIYKAFSSTTFEDAIYLYSIAECFRIFQDDHNIWSYISRLKSDSEVIPTLFELFIGKTLKERWLEFKGLQLNNKENNPVELVFQDENKVYWIECKSTKPIPFKDDLLERIVFWIGDETKKYYKVKKLAFRIIIESEIVDLFSPNKALINTLKNVVSDIYTLDIFNFPIWIQSPIDSSIKWKVEWYSFDDISQDNMHNHIFNNSDKGWAHAWVKKHSWIWGMPEVDYDKQIFKSIFWVKYLHWDYDKKISATIREKFLNQVEDKIKQQKNLLDSWEFVVIVLDYKIIDWVDIPSIENKIDKKYKTLLILIAEETRNPHIDFKFHPFFIGSEIGEDFLLKLA